MRSGACGPQESSPFLLDLWSCWHWKTRLKQEVSRQLSSQQVFHWKTSFYDADICCVSHEFSTCSLWFRKENYVRRIGVKTNRLARKCTSRNNLSLRQRGEIQAYWIIYFGMSFQIHSSGCDFCSFCLSLNVIQDLMHTGDLLSRISASMSSDR